MIKTQTPPGTQTSNLLGYWQGDHDLILTEPEAILKQMREIETGFIVVENHGQAGFVATDSYSQDPSNEASLEVIAHSKAMDPGNFGDRGFQENYNVRRSYMAGAMANGISGVDLVVALGKAGYLASYGAGGQHPDKVEDAISAIQVALPSGPYAFNLIHNPAEPLLEQKTVDLYLKHGVRTVEASAYLRLTPMVVQYRAAGLEVDPDGKISKKNKLIAKLSRPEVARQFMNPAPDKVLGELVDAGKITQEQAQLAARVSMADDITVEADSGGHTDNRPLVGLLPSIVSLRNSLMDDHDFHEQIRIGAAGGIGTPAAALAAYSMGAAYIVTGSINQACLEAGTSESVKKALAQASAADMMMSPSADMFEMGGRVQVLKRGTMFPLRAQKLYDIYLNYGGVEEINGTLKQELEQKIFQMEFDAIWDECVRFFSERDPQVLENAKGNPKRKMALIFRWYLGLATHWGIQGNPERAMDYQVWCGPAMGSFNDWVKGTYLEHPENRSVVDVADQLLNGAAFLYRVNHLALQGIQVPPSWYEYQVEN